MINTALEPIIDNRANRIATNVFHDINTKHEALQKLAKGEPVTKIANDYNVTPSAVSNLKKREKIQVDAMIAILEQTTSPLILEKAHRDQNTANELSKYIADPINNANTTALLASEDILAFNKDQNKIGVRILESTGILQSRNINNYIQNQQINNKNSVNIAVSEEVLTMFGDHINQLSGSEMGNEGCIEAEMVKNDE